MARYQHLPIYSLTYELLTALTKSLHEFPREYKFTIGQKLQDEVIGLVVLIYKANSAQAKTLIIEEFLERVQVVELLIRLSLDLRILPKKNYSALVEMVESLSRQAQGWKKISAKSK